MLNAFRHHCGRHAGSSTRQRGRYCQCSTPFGITEVGTRRSCVSKAAADHVLNAFRHHCGRHVRIRRRWRIHGFGAQRLSASLRSAQPGLPTLLRRRRHVLNAFRHHCGRHVAQVARSPSGTWPCSTPFGITEVGTCTAMRSNTAGPALCSTPFGITAVGTSRGRLSAMPRPSSAQRLSASLRSALRSPLSAAFDSSKGAQRLSASLRSARHAGPRPRAMRLTCSTPFGITAVGTIRDSVMSGHAGLVLNAFRHHCCRHWSWRRARPNCRVAVLNAFRHHCGRHAGIRSGSRPRPAVLNAFRHH